MNERIPPDELRELPIAKRLQLLEDLWVSLSEEPEKLGVPRWHREELDRRLAAEERDQSAAKPWAEVKTEILNALRK